jgi:hypothetical protein
MHKESFVPVRGQFRDLFVQLMVQAIERKLEAIGNTKLLIKLR